MVDTGNGTKTDEVLKAIQELAKQQKSDLLPGYRYVRPESPHLAGDPASAPIRFIINTSVDGDHRGGNASISESGFFHPFVNGLRIIGHLAVLNRTTRLPANEQPTDTYDTPYLKLQPYTNGDAIQIMHMPKAHTDGDSVVWFRGADVISTGDLFGDDYPVIDIEKGATVQGLIDALNDLIDLAFPGYMSQEGTLFIPGHGRLGDSADLAYYQEMVTVVRDRVKDMKSKGMSLEQVKAARPTFDYDPIYGRKTGTADRFVEQVYLSLRE
jgi:glyoxylase-like metal-dependent hydrolase (beta-lactamase superfamily II)